MIIATGNGKIGKIPNISLPPGVTCGDVPCLDRCYAMKFYQCREVCRNAWNSNHAHYLYNPVDYFTCIREYIDRRKVEYFRFHSAGDIPDQAYLDGIKSLAVSCPGTKFLCFTKRYGLKYGRVPENVSFVFSVWPGMRLPRARFPLAYMQDGTETRVKNAIDCPGGCDSCFMCWNLAGLGKNVVFKLH